MEDITEVAADLVSDNNHKTASLASFVGLTVMVGSVYGIGKLVGARRQKRKMAALNTVPVAPVQYIDTTAT